VVVSELRRKTFTILRSEFAAEAAADFPRLRRIPQTDIIWFLDYFAGLGGPERNALLDALADSAVMAFPPLVPEVPAAAPALAQMMEARNRPGAKGGTRYMDLKQLSALPSLREPGGYHESWRENLTPLHFQPRPDLLPDLNHLKAAKAPLIRKLVNKAFREAPWELKSEKQPGGVSKYIGRSGDGELTIRVDFGSMLHQLGYNVTLKSATGQPLVLLLDYERLWATTGRWDYLTEDNAPRCIAALVEQVDYLAKLGERIKS
jgi:hypothetical protein